MRNSGGQLFWGLVFVAGGLVILLINTGLLPGSLSSLWPLALLLAGLWLVIVAVRRPAGRGLVGGLVAMAIGGFWFAEAQGWASQELFPAVLFLSIGAGLLGRGLVFRGR